MARLQPNDRGPLIIAAGIVVAGVFIALALYLGQSGSGTNSTAEEPFDPRATPQVSAAPAIDPGVADAEATDGLQEVANAATIIGLTKGDLAAATTLELSKDLPAYTYLPSTRPSSRANEISIAAESTAWSAASESASGTCFWVRLALGPDKTEVFPSYGAGLPCTGQAAKTASKTAFPGIV